MKLRILFMLIGLTTAMSGFNVSAALELPQVIRPGDTWLDDRGKHIQAHGGGIIKLSDTYY